MLNVARAAGVVLETPVNFEWLIRELVTGVE